MVQSGNSCDFKNITTSMNCLRVKTGSFDDFCVDVKKIKKKIRDFFDTTPIIIDFSECSNLTIEHLERVYAFLIEEGFQVVGVKNVKEKIRNELKNKKEIPVFSNSSPSPQNSEVKDVKQSNELDKLSFLSEDVLVLLSGLTNEKIVDLLTSQDREQVVHSDSVNTSTKIIKEVIRKGQQVVNKDGDIIILNNVNGGSEVISSGSVVVTELVEGKIFAGVGFNEDGEGDNNAIIYIERFNPLFVSINGIYKHFETVDKKLLNKRVLITLDNDALKIETLSE